MLCHGQLHTACDLCPPQHHMSRGSSTGGGGGHWKESPKKNAMNELQDKLMTVRLREAEAQAELREVKLKALQLESQVRQTADSHSLAAISNYNATIMCKVYTRAWCTVVLDSVPIPKRHHNTELLQSCGSYSIQIYTLNTHVCCACSDIQ